ncbi:MAG TPA: preprotein translocase subunit YajC [Pseudoflavonifractor sp.]|nr:preprotein translocase subunit YajC [Pseudoflavonifractor sp.]
MPLDSNSLMSIAMLVVLVVVFYFMLIRPESKRKKEAAKMRSELAVSDFITTIGGIMGTICAVKEDSIVIETGADRVRIELAKWAVSSKGAQATENADSANAEKK